MRSLNSLGAFIIAAASLAGCDTANKPPVSTPTGSVDPATSAAPTATLDPAGPTSTGAAPETPSATPTASGSTAPTSAPSGTPASAAEMQWVGSWSSASCGGRTFERRIELKRDKTFSAQDLVSPCPPKVQCIWAGIVFWSGTWAADDKGVLLTKTAGGPDPSKKSKTDAPVRLVWDKAASAPAEMGDAGKACVYAKSKDESGR